MAVRLVRRAPQEPLATNCTCGGKLLLAVQYLKVKGRLKRCHQVVCSQCDRVTSEVQVKLQHDPTDRLLLEWQALAKE